MKRDVQGKNIVLFRSFLEQLFISAGLEQEKLSKSN